MCVYTYIYTHTHTHIYIYIYIFFFFPLQNANISICSKWYAYWKENQILALNCSSVTLQQSQVCGPWIPSLYS